LIPYLSSTQDFPAVTGALVTPNGLLAAGSALNAERILTAYRLGIFPWFNQDEAILWWSPNPRMVLPPHAFKPSHSLIKTLRQQPFQLKFDTAFTAVMNACAAPRKNQAGTWIHPEMIDAYSDLHRLGYAHSVEVWEGNALVGGLYGLAIGKIFYGESMFSLVPNSSKIALAYLCAQLARWQFGLIDCQMNTAHLASLGAYEIPRSEFITQLEVLVNCAPVFNWQFDSDLFP
jgi:leucyl/phenylalanyl-tRNA---protein transferase